MASCNVFAEPMLDDDNFLKEYATQLHALQEAGDLPSDLKKEMTYQVYSFEGSGSGYGAHRSIVLSSDGKRFFSMELRLITVDGINRIYPFTQKIDECYKGKLKFHGTVKMSTGTLLSRGVTILKEFGNYFMPCNNCQDYCNYYLEAIGLGDTKMMTDGQKASLISLAVGVLAILLMLILKK